MLVLRPVLSPDIHDFLVMELIIIQIFIDLNTLTIELHLHALNMELQHHIL